MKQVPRLKSLLICAGAYATALAAAVFVAVLMKGSHPIAIVAAADVTATIIIFIFSIWLDNSSMYDPYWSVAPIIIAAYYFYISPGYADTLRLAAVTALTAVWGIRLTANWARQWTGLGHEDWRYADMRKKHGRAYWAVSFFGIHFFPTVIVFAGSLSLYPAMVMQARSWNYLDTLAVCITLIAIIIESVSDNQLRAFTRSNTDPQKVFDTGLWAYSRHPNYFGEILFWIGLFCFSLAANPVYWWAAAGPLAMICLFTFISIPLMEKHMLAKRPKYEEKMKNVSPLIIWFRRGSENTGQPSK